MKKYNPSEIFKNFNYENEINEIYKNIHCPASTYVATGYSSDFASQLRQGLNTFEKQSILIKQITMNENTYSWLFRLFNTPVNTKSSPLSSTAYNEYLFDYPINIVSNSALEDGKILFEKGMDYGVV